MRDFFRCMAALVVVAGSGCETTPETGDSDWPDGATTGEEAEAGEVKTGLLRGQAYYQIADYDSAEREYRKVLAIDPDNEDAKSGLYMAERAKAMVGGTNALDWGRPAY